MLEWNEFISLENIYLAWKDFLSGKQGRPDVIAFKSHLEDELWSLHGDFLSGNYRHAGYTRFIVHDPKKRVIHKASVRDRVVHRMVYNAILPIFDRVWLDCSFACRPGRGQHASIDRVSRALKCATANYTRVHIVVKCDVRKFFDYYRYADDVLMLFSTEAEAHARVAQIDSFLQEQLRMQLHQGKTIVRKTSWGIDWLGQVLLPGYRVLRPVTRRRMMRHVEEGLGKAESPEKVRGMLASYFGLIKWVAHARLHAAIMQKVALRRDIWYGESGKFKEHALE